MSNFSPDEESQIINELVQIKKEIINLERGISLNVAFGIFGYTVIAGFIWFLLQVISRKPPAF